MKRTNFRAILLFFVVNVLATGLSAQESKININPNISSAITANNNPLVNAEQDSYMKQKVTELVQNQPVQFLENKGQMKDINGEPIPFVFFRAKAPGLNIYLTNKGLT